MGMQINQKKRLNPQLLGTFFYGRLNFQGFPINSASLVQFRSKNKPDIQIYLEPHFVLGHLVTLIGSCNVSQEVIKTIYSRSQCYGQGSDNEFFEIRLSGPFYNIKGNMVKIGKISTFYCLSKFRPITHPMKKDLITNLKGN